MSEHKICNICTLPKLLSDFPGMGKKHSKCNACRKIAYQIKNNSRVCLSCTQAKTRDNFIGNSRYCITLVCQDLRSLKLKESIRKSSRTYCKTNPDKIKIKSAKFYKRKYYSGTLENIIDYRLQGCRKRAKEKHLEYNIDSNFVIKLCHDQNDKCALTGIKFDHNFDDSFSKRPFSISIDRIDSKLGYIKNNVRLVCSIVNTALSEYGDIIFDTICEASVIHKNKEKNNVQ